MLLAYIDEIGEPGAFVSRDDRRFNTSPAFGYAGFIIPEDYARQFGATFVKEKRIRFAEKMREKGHGQWEAKGSEFFTKKVIHKGYLDSRERRRQAGWVWHESPSER